ncbi:pilin [Cupriavidus sp. DL-D2]|uniref:pilin n=1 Tax=Cupriavidus sp. DL-D2 TaxID=3144974 RepID=UPI0032120428
MESKFDTIQPVHSPSLRPLSLRRRAQCGFTLIELMIVVAIVGILAAFAVPQYQDYIARAQFGEALSLASGQKPQVTEYFSHNGTCPANATAAVDGIPKASDINGTYVASVTLGGDVTDAGGCTIKATFKDAKVAKGLLGKTVTLTMGNANQGSVTWACTSNAVKSLLSRDCEATK